MPRSVNNSGPIGGMFGRRREQGSREGSSAPRPPQGPPHEHVLDHDVALARWLGQVGHSSTPHAMEQLAARPDYSALIWQMKKMGLDLRVRALQALGRTPLTADPLAPSPVKSRLILEAAWRGLDGYPHGPLLPKPWAVSDDNGMLTFRERLTEQCGMVPYAWILTYPDGLPPFMAYDFTADRYFWEVDGQWRQPRMATLHAAMCLAFLYRDYGFYRSHENPGGIILPPNPQRFDRAITVPIHAFMRALLGLGESCPPRFGCPCNKVLWQIREAANAAASRFQPDDLNTDLLPPYPYGPQQPPQILTPRHTPPQEHPAIRPSIRSAPISELHRHHHRDEDESGEVPDETPPSDQESDGWGRGV